MATHESDSGRRWTPDRRIPLATITVWSIGFILQSTAIGGGAIWWAAAESAKIDIVQKEHAQIMLLSRELVTADELARARLTRVEVRQEEVLKRLDKVDVKLDKIDDQLMNNASKLNDLKSR